MGCCFSFFICGPINLKTKPKESTVANSKGKKFKIKSPHFVCFKFWIGQRVVFLKVNIDRINIGALLSGKRDDNNLLCLMSRDGQMKDFVGVFFFFFFL